MLSLCALVILVLTMVVLRLLYWSLSLETLRPNFSSSGKFYFIVTHKCPFLPCLLNPPSQLVTLHTFSQAILLDNHGLSCDYGLSPGIQSQVSSHQET